MRSPRFLLATVCLACLLRAEAADKIDELRGISRASFNHDGSRVVVRRGEAVTIWELPAGTPIIGDLDPNEQSGGFLMSADCKMVAISLRENRCRVFDPATAKAISPVLDFRLNAEFQMPGLFSPDGNTLLLFGDREAAAFETRTGKKLGALRLGDDATHEDAASSAAFAPDGSQCFVMNGAGSLTSYDTRNWKTVGKPIRHPSAEAAYEFGFSVSPDGKWLATYDDPGENGPKSNLQVWDATTGKALGKPLVAVNGMAGRFVGSSRILVLAGRGEATVRDLPSVKIAFALPAHDDIDGPRAEISPDQKWILAWGADKRLDLIDTATGKVAANYAGPLPISKVIIGSESATAYVVFEGAQDQSLVKLVFPELKAAQQLPVADFILGLSLSRDGKRLLIQHGGSDEERLDFYDAATLKPVE